MLRCENAKRCFYVFVRLDDALTIPLTGIDGHIWGKHSTVLFSFLSFYFMRFNFLQKRKVCGNHFRNVPTSYEVGLRFVSKGLLDNFVYI